MRLGILGGTFDPIHRGHLDAAHAARRAMGLDRVLFVPAHVPPHRARAPVASAFHRFAMTALAVLDQDGFRASDLELTRPGPSFSVDTIRLLRIEGWMATQLFFITGVDAFADVDTWHAYPALLDESHFVVVTRPGHSLEALKARLPALASRFREPRQEGAVQGRRDAESTAIIAIDTPTADVSSTDIRQVIASGGDIEGLVPPIVHRYIRQHALYEPAAAAPQLHGQI